MISLSDEIELREAIDIWNAAEAYLEWANKPKPKVKGPGTFSILFCDVQFPPCPPWQPSSVQVKAAEGVLRKHGFEVPRGAVLTYRMIPK